MKRRLFALSICVWVAGTLIGPVEISFAGADTSPSWQYGLSFSYLTGDYGGDEDTDIYYTALSIKRYLGEGDVTLTIPYLDISDGATYVGGEVEPIAGGGGGSGPGDVILKGRYYAVEQDELLPYIDLVGSIKLPTADEDKGLGTGKTDLTFMAEFARRLESENLIALWEVGYTFVGDPSGYDADNRWLYSAGLAYELDSEITLSGYLDGRTAIFEGNDDPLSLLLIGEYKYRPDLRFDTLLEIGLNDGAPDFGITFRVRKRF
ncbi:MAG: transporter [Planctomycetota bacterium]